MKSEKELFRLAKDMVFIEDNMRDERTSEWVKDELKEEAAKISNVLLAKNYDVNTFLYYKDLYREMTIAEYYEFMDSLDEGEE